MEQTILSRKKLAERWGLSVRAIEEYEKRGLLSRLRKFDSPQYSIREVTEIEELKDFSTSYEARRYKRKVEELEEENRKLKSIIAKAQCLFTEAVFSIVKED